jgi:dTDP-glucose pyrophosphorylase
MMLKWEHLLLRSSALVAEAIQLLDQADEKIVLVVDEGGSLLGTITDGDIRRGLLRGRSMQSEIGVIMNTRPTVAYSFENLRDIRERAMGLNLKYIPVVDARRVVCGLAGTQVSSKRKLHDVPVFIMAGGFGKRLRPLTENTPKPMLRVRGKPILERLVDDLTQYGFQEFYVSTHYRAEVIRDYFGDGSSRGIKITYVHEDEPLGTAGAIKLLPDSIAGSTIVIVNGDILTRVNYLALLDFHTTHGDSATVCVTRHEYQVPYGVLFGRNCKVTRIVEKPIQQYFVNAGIYVVSLDAISSAWLRGYCDMPDLLQLLVDSGKGVNMFPMHEYWLDIGRMDDFSEAQSNATFD